MSDEIFQPLTFRNLRVKNRIFRSNVSGRFDNYDGSGNQARINWGAEVRAGRRRGDHLIVRVRHHSRAESIPNYATIDTDARIPFWRELGRQGTLLCDLWGVRDHGDAILSP